MRTALRSAAWDIVVAFFAASAVFAVVFGLGRLSHPPTWLPSPGVVAVATDSGGIPDGGPTGDGGDIAASVPALRAIVDDMGGIGAAATATGAIEDRLIFVDIDHFDVTTAPPRDCQGDECVPGDPRMSIAYFGDGIKLTVIATVTDTSGVLTEGVTPVLTVGPQTFIAKSGDCVMTLTAFAFGGEPGRFAQQQADIAGEMACSGVAEVRSGDTITYTTVFILKTLEEVPP